MARVQPNVAVTAYPLTSLKPRVAVRVGPYIAYNPALNTLLLRPIVITVSGIASM